MGLWIVANNMHGWSNGMSYLNSLCLENDIVFYFGTLVITW